MSEFKILILILLAAVVGSLGKALFHMSAGPQHSEQMARSLTARIALSLTLFAVLAIGWYCGLIQPSGGPG
jgi:hypothetical protein